MLKMTAKRVGLQISHGSSVVTFDTTRREYLSFQRAKPPSPDAEPDELSLDEVYIERRGQGWAARGGIEFCQLYRNSLQLRVSDSTARRLGEEHEFEITFKIGDDKYTQLRDMMRSVFRGQTTFHEASNQPILRSTESGEVPLEALSS